MGASWQGEPTWSVVDRISEATGIDVGHLLLTADDDELRETANAQLAVFSLGMVVCEAVQATGLKAAAVAGHSLGEYGALVASRAISLEDAAVLVAERGLAMREAATINPGTMAAVIGAEDEDVAGLCASIDGDVWAANFNTKGQVVIGGSQAAVGYARSLAEGAGATGSVSLTVSGAFHTPYMAPALARMRPLLEAARWADSDVPVVANVDASQHTIGEVWPRLLAAQITNPVRWHRSIQSLAVLGCGMYVEMGAKTLTPMMRRILSDTTAISVTEPGDLIDLAEQASKPTPNTPPLLRSGDIPSFPDPHEIPEDLVIEGEMSELLGRMVVADGTGCFDPTVDCGQRVDRGQSIGHISGREVISHFAGVIEHFIAYPGEKVRRYQAIAWLSPG